MKNEEKIAKREKRIKGDERKSAANNGKVPKYKVEDDVASLTSDYSVAAIYPKKFLDSEFPAEYLKDLGSKKINEAYSSKAIVYPTKSQLEKARKKLEKLLKVGVPSKEKSKGANEIRFGSENIIGVAIGEKKIADKFAGTPAVIVLVANKVEQDKVDPKYSVPALVDGIPTDVIASGRFYASSNETTGPFRPAGGGLSIGHKHGGSGSIGCIVQDQNRKIYILSCNHVIGIINKAGLGDPILQPSPIDGGNESEHVIAYFARGIKLNVNGGTNRVDCAIAETHTALVSPFNHKFGEISDKTVSPNTGMKVMKFGRTTGETHGIIRYLNFGPEVIYRPSMDVAKFSEQFLIESIGSKPFCGEGDSGALILDQYKRAVGLLVSTDGKLTVASPIANVLNALRVRIVA